MDESTNVAEVDVVQDQMMVEAMGDVEPSHIAVLTKWLAESKRHPQRDLLIMKRLLILTRTFPITQLGLMLNKTTIIDVAHRAFLSGKTDELHQTSLRVLTNILVLKPDLRRVFVECELVPEAIERYLEGYDEEELACASLLLFSSVNTGLNVDQTLEKTRLVDGISKAINNLIKHNRLPTPEASSPGSATLKLLSTVGILSKKPELFSSLLNPLFDLLERVQIPDKDPMQPPISLIINCLYTVPPPKGFSYSKKHAERLLELLQICLATYHEDHSKLDREMVPLALTILRITETGDKEAKKIITDRIFPTEKDREEVLGRGTTLPHKVLAHVTNPVAANFAQAMMSVYYELSDHNVQTFVSTVGFGNAAGFLSSRGIKMSESELAGTKSGPSFAVNPITGQRLDMETTVEMPEMTDEEKEREAERLFVLFERLRATGVVDIENPVTKAKHEGRFEELPDSSDED